MVKSDGITPLRANKSKTLPLVEAAFEFMPPDDGDYYLIASAEKNSTGYYIFSVQLISRQVVIRPPSPPASPLTPTPEPPAPLPASPSPSPAPKTEGDNPQGAAP